jgi:hypothetical protein
MNVTLARAANPNAGRGSPTSPSSTEAENKPDVDQPSSTQRRLSYLLAAGAFLCLVIGYSAARSYPPRSDEMILGNVVSTTTDVKQAKWKSIETIRVGDRVLTETSDGDLRNASSVNPWTWRRLVLRADNSLPDGTPDPVNVETLQPPEWFAEHEARVGAWVPLPLDLVEMGLPDGLKARVIANEPCPSIPPRSGRLVLTTVNHLNDDVRELTVEDESGRRESFRPTGLHRFFREVGGLWVATRDLWVGDGIKGRYGSLTVIANERVHGVHRVYNMSVEGERIYVVSGLGAIAHNNGCAQVARRLTSFRYAGQYGIDSFSALQNITAGKGGTIQAHHLIEKRFVQLFPGETVGSLKSIVLTETEHLEFTRQWRTAIGHVTDNNPLNTNTATRAQVEAAARRIYSEFPEILNALGL